MVVPTELVQREWRAALDDAGLNHDAVALWTCEGFAAVPSDTPACCYPAVLGVREDDPFLPALQQAGHDLEYEDRPRVAMFLDFLEPEVDKGVPVEAMVAGLLRHELEHVKQFMYWHALGVDLYELDGLMDRMLDLKAENKGALYNAKPSENDANAAASRHLQRRYDAARHAIHDAGRYCELVRYPSGPEDMESLVPRLVVFGLLIRSQLDARAREGHETVARLVETYGRAGTGQLWADLAAVIDNWR